MDKETFFKAEKLSSEIKFLTDVKENFVESYENDVKIGFTLRLHYKDSTVELSEPVDFLTFDQIKGILQNHIHKAESLFKDL